MPEKGKARRPKNPATTSDETPMRPGAVTAGRLEREGGATQETVGVEDTGRTVADGELPIEERREKGIKDNVRHVDSIGRR